MRGILPAQGTQPHTARIRPLRTLRDRVVLEHQQRVEQFAKSGLLLNLRQTEMLTPETGRGAKL